MGMIAIIMAVGQVFIDSGFTSALIRKLDRKEEDYSTTFIFNFLSSITCYAVIYILSVRIAGFYNQPELVSIIKVTGLTLVLNSFIVVQKAKLTIEMNFKTLAKCSLLSMLISASISITMAFNGFGVWSLVAQSLASSIFNVIFIWIVHPVRLTLRFSYDSFFDLFGFGYKLLVSSLIDTIFKNIYQLVIGKNFTPVDVGYFTQANQLSGTPCTTITTVVQRVTYPMMAKIQNDDVELSQSYQNTLQLTALLTFPLMFGLCFLAHPFVYVVLGSKWVPSAELISILSLAFLLYPIHAINLNVLQVKGRSDLFLKLEIIKKTILSIILMFTIPIGVEAICVGIVAQSYLALIINTYYTSKLTSLSQYTQITCLLPIWVTAGFSCWMSVNISNLMFPNSSFVYLMVSALISIIVYAFLIMTLNRSLFALAVKSIRL